MRHLHSYRNLLDAAIAVAAAVVAVVDTNSSLKLFLESHLANSYDAV